MSKLILIVGLTGAGKTTYSDEESVREKAVIYSIDRMMKSLFWGDMPERPDMNWFVENQKWYTDRITRCEDFIEGEIAKLAKLGISCILDLGFTSQAHRHKYISMAKEHGMKPEVHFLDIPLDVRWKRVEKRNDEKSKTYSMDVSREMFDYMETIFEPLSELEKTLLVQHI